MGLKFIEGGADNKRDAVGRALFADKGIFQLICMSQYIPPSFYFFICKMGVKILILLIAQGSREKIK